MIASGEGHCVYQAYAISDNAFAARKLPLVNEACLTAGGRGAAFAQPVYRTRLRMSSTAAFA
jgi:hypothetical protein